MIIRIKNLRLQCIIGIYEKERREKQEVCIHAEIEFDGNVASNSDRIEDTVDYHAIYLEIIDHIENSNYFLLEKMALELLKLIQKYPKVKGAKVEIEKPAALPRADAVSVEASFP